MGVSEVQPLPCAGWWTLRSWTRPARSSRWSCWAWGAPPCSYQVPALPCPCLTCHLQGPAMVRLACLLSFAF